MEIIIVHLSIFLQNPRPCSLCFNVISCWRSVLFNPNVPMVTLTLSSAFSNAWVTSHLDGCLSTFLIIQFSVSFERVLFFFFFFFLFISQCVTLYPAIPALFSTLFWESQPYLHGLMTSSSAPASLNSTTGTNYKCLEFKWPQGECLPIICPTC